MISSPDRQQAVALIKEAHQAGARLQPACQALAIDVRTYQRWSRGGAIKTDGRPAQPGGTGRGAGDLP